MFQEHNLVPVTNGKADPFLLSPPLSELVEKAGFGPYLDIKSVVDLFEVYVDRDVHSEKITIDSTNVKLNNLLLSLTTAHSTSLYQFNVSRYSTANFRPGNGWATHNRDLTLLLRDLNSQALEHIDGPVVSPDFIFSLCVTARYDVPKEKIILGQAGFTSNSPDHIGEVKGINFIVPAFEAEQKQSFTYK